MDFQDFPMIWGNLGVETDHPPKMCAGLTGRIPPEVLGERWPRGGERRVGGRVPAAGAVPVAQGLRLQRGPPRRLGRCLRRPCALVDRSADPRKWSVVGWGCSVLF